jgi:glycosyltransferase involved in cell wall biosynthesis
MYQVEEHDFQLHKRLYLDVAYRILARSSVQITTVSEWARRDIARRLAISENRIEAIPHGVDEAFFADDPSPRLGEVPEAPYLLSVAASYPHKRFDVLLDAFKRIMVADSDLHLVLAGTHVGNAATREALLSRVKASPAQARIVVLGRLPWSCMPALYRHAEALVVSSAYEGFGMPAAEALASGTPVVTVPVPPIVEIVSGVGWVAAGWGPQELADAIVRRLDAPAELVLERTGKGKVLAAEKYRWSRVAESLMRVFSGLT